MSAESFLDEMHVAETAARAGGEVVRSAGLRTHTGDLKGIGDYVTDVDLAAESSIRSVLARETPSTPVRGEEMGSDARAGRYWTVDPLDGTTNFIHGFWAVGVSVALIEAGRPVASCVHAPFLGSVWRAAVGEGAWSVDADGSVERLRVSVRPPERAVVATGFPFRHKERLPRYLSVMGAALEMFEDLRRPGAASLDLAWVASGVFDGFFELGLAEWDVAAGGLLILEAGGIVTDWSGGGGWLGGDILAGSPQVQRALSGIAARRT
jgi:myo-inositol-1(or 4)-monophosphatase